ncbi:hypothetical protein BT93_D0354 [Corymbia citriodora subsp. variegata]|nr:hypothetical protein BT93_D0354 [Corymbia citriodora subsp. variegata]KAF8031130.1 hypothetical protein BT93_D0354 [Corymbia citriodora subsp. variegata]
MSEHSSRIQIMMSAFDSFVYSRFVIFESVSLFNALCFVALHGDYGEIWSGIMDTCGHFLVNFTLMAKSQKETSMCPICRECVQKFSPEQC